MREMERNVSGKMGNRRVLSIPSRGMAKLNPFPALLADSLEERGWVVDGNDPSRYLRQKYDAVIIHWPDHFSSTRSFLVAWVRTFMLFGLLSYLKLRGARIVRIVHDSAELSEGRRLLRRINRYLAAKLTDHYVFLSESSREGFFRIFPELKEKPAETLFHPRFGDPVSFDDASQPTGRALRFVGDIRAYKGLDEFLALYASAETDTALEIIGHCDDRDYATVIQAGIDAARAAGRTISWEDRRPGHDEMRQILEQSAAIVLPYKTGWNSGMAVNVLERGAPLLCSSLPVFKELSDDLGPPWVTCFKGDGSDLGEAIAKAMNAQISDDQRRNLADALNALDWPRFAEGFERAFAA